MAKYAGDSKDPYLDVDTGILRNRLEIKDQATLDKVEASFSILRGHEIKDFPVEGKFDLSHLKNMHKRLFDDVYDWAGQVREVDITKGNTRFAHANLIESAGSQIFNQLAREKQLRGLDADEFSRRAGYYLGEINVLHPFREGNGRAQREFIGQLAEQAGYQISWQKVMREEMTLASIEAYNGDPGRMGNIIRKNLVDKDRQRADELAKEAAGDKVKIERAEPGKSYNGRVIGHTDRYIVQELTASPSEMILHNRRALSVDAADLRDKNVEIRYPHGDVGLVRQGSTQEKTKEHDRQGPQTGQREHGKEK